MNRHCVWGEAFLRLHEGHWDRSNCIPVGCYRLDDVQTAQNADRQQALTENYAERFGGRRPLILLLFPSLSWYTLRSRVRELLEGLKLLQQLPGPFQIVCRFRDAHQRQQWMEVGLAELFNTDPRITEDVSSFSTAEWMALSDLIISNSHSTGIIEAAGSHKPCVAFDYMTTAEKVFSRYSSTVAIKSREELVDLVKKAQAGHLPSLAGGAWLAKDYSFYSDGQNTNRFRGAVTELMKSPFVLALSRDPGGAEVLEPVVEALRNQERFRIHHLHLKTRQSFSAWRREARRRLQESRPDFLLTATSHGSGMEKAFIREAALRGIPCLTVLDSWSNYRSRFLEPGETLASHRLPSVIGVMDDFAVQEMEQLGFPKDRLRIVGQPGFDRFLEWARKSSTQSLRSQFRSEHGIGPDEKLVVFFSQPIRQMDGPPGSASYRGYREEEALQLLMRCLSERKGRTPFRLLVKLHPKEKSGKYDKLFRNASIPVQLFDSGHANALLLASDIAVGMTSTMLIKAALLNRPVLSIQPNQQGEERLMLSRRQFLRSCRDESAVRETLETAWMTEPQQGRFSSFSSVVGDGRSTQRIVDQIQSLLKNRAPKREPRTVLIESAALLPIFSGWKQLRQAERILFFCAHHLAEEKRAPFRRRLAERLLHRLNSRADIRDLSEELTADLGYSNNLESDRYVEQVFQKIQKTASYKLVFQQINDPHADRFYKMRVLPRVLRVTQFLRTAEYLKKYSVDLTVLPSTLYEESLRVPPILRAYLKCQKLCRRFLRVLTFYNVWAIVGAGPLFLFQQGWRAGIRRSFKPVQADVIHPIVYGTQEDGLFQGIRTGIDDDWVLNGALDSSRLAFYFSDWKFSPDEERVQRERLKQRGIECFHPARLPLTFRTLREQLALSFQMGWEILRYPRILSEEGWIARISASLFYQYLRELHFCQSVEYKISVEQQDHSAAHVIRTIVANRFGRLTVGMHHGVPEGPYGLPMLRYVHINRYGVWGRAFQQSYAGFWESTQTVPIGDFRLDWIIAAQQPERLRQLETRYQTQFGGIRPLVVVLFPTLGEYHLRTRLTEFLEGLRLLKTLPGAFQVVCRFRSQALAQDYLRLGLDAILQADSRILIDLTEFTTPEWMALADVVIANSISTGLLEAASCGKVCFTFDTMRLAERVYSPYGKNLVLKDRHEFVRVVQNASGSFEGWECRWSQLAQDYNYFSDGRNIERFQNLLLQTLDPEKHPAVPMQPEAVLSGAAV